MSRLFCFKIKKSHGEASPLSLRWQSRTICIRKCSLHPVREKNKKDTPRGSISTAVTMAEPNDLHSQMSASSREREKQKRQDKTCLFCLAPPRGIEPRFQPWEGCVLTAWPWGRVVARPTVKKQMRCFSNMFVGSSFFEKISSTIFSRFAKIAVAIFERGVYICFKR